MKASLLLKSGLLSALGWVLLSGCAYHEGTVYRDPGWTANSLPGYVDSGVAQNEPVMPAPTVASIVEQKNNAPPGPGYVWVSGNWVSHDRWTWEPGRYVYSPDRASVWGTGRYIYSNGRTVYIRD
jgi:hypothetical protein